VELMVHNDHYKIRIEQNLPDFHLNVYGFVNQNNYIELDVLFTICRKCGEMEFWVAQFNGIPHFNETMMPLTSTYAMSYGYVIPGEHH
jgi:hypothetical protein